MKRKDKLSPKSKTAREERLRRDARILTKRMQGQTLQAIADQEGVTPVAIFYRLKSLSPELKEVLELNHYDLNTAVRKMIELTDAKQVQFFANEGIVTDKRTTNDNQTRIRAREIMLKVHGVDMGGVRIDASINQQINVLGEPERQQLILRAQKLIELEAKEEEK